MWRSDAFQRHQPAKKKRRICRAGQCGRSGWDSGVTRLATTRARGSHKTICIAYPLADYGTVTVAVEDVSPWRPTKINSVPDVVVEEFNRASGNGTPTGTVMSSFSASTTGRWP